VALVDIILLMTHGDIPQNGKCYERAFHYIKENKANDNLRLVHGEIYCYVYKADGLPTKNKLRMGHAWVEDMSLEIVIDPSGGKRKTVTVTKNDYYAKYNVDVDKLNRYTYNEMLKIGFENGGNYGPWKSRK